MRILVRNRDSPPGADAMTDPRYAMHRTILVVDVERFGSPARTDRDRVAVRADLYRVLAAAMATASVDLADCDDQNCGDGILVVIPPTVPKSLLVDSLPGRLVAELHAHNETHDPARQIRLRLALHAGEVRYDDHGVVGTSINHAFRLLDAPAFKAAFARSAGPLGVIASAWFFEEVVRHGDAAAYQRIRVTVKETDTTAWIHLPGGTTTLHVTSQLPLTGRHFVGREDELDRLAEVLDQPDAPTVVITAIAGTAGIGKTTLATRWATNVRHRFPDGQLHVDLRGFDSRAELDPAQALHGFLEALGVAAAAIPGDPDARSALYRSLVAERRMLVLLDNARSADQVRPLLPNSPTCFVLITSRNRLDSLVVREGAHRIELDVLPVADAVRVLACHIPASRLAAESDAVLRLVDLCARLPLALSVVAARAANQPHMSLGHLAEQLRDERDRLDVLDLGERDLDVRAVLSWSYRVLSAPAARLFRLIGLHPGPDIDVLACAAIADGKVGPLLTELTAAHLLDEHQPGRYRFHDLLRVYAKECAEQDEPDLEAAKERIVDFYLNAATVADCHIQPCRDGKLRKAPPSTFPPHLSDSRDAMAWFARENATLLAVLAFAAQNGLGKQVWRLAREFNTFLNRSGQVHERAAVYRAAAEIAADEHARLSALTLLARALARLRRFDEAELVLEKASGLVGRAVAARTAGVQLAYVLVFELRERYLDALRHAQRAWEIARDQPNAQLHADALTNLARQHALVGSPDQALSLGERALTLYREMGHREGEAIALSNLGYAHRRLRRYQRAIEAIEQSLAIDRQLGSRYWEARMLDKVGDMRTELGQRYEALTAWREAATIFDRLHTPDGAAVRAKIDEVLATSP
jgi:tetratricopeptide (TPR) repeat protein